MLLVKPALPSRMVPPSARAGEHTSRLVAGSGSSDFFSLNAVLARLLALRLTHYPAASASISTTMSTSE